MSLPTGIIYGESSSVYHGSDSISSSKLADMRVGGFLCPLNFFVRHVSKTAPRKKGAHFDIGLAAHLAILEGPHAYTEGCVLEPETYKNDKGEVKPWHNGAAACKAWRESVTGRIILSREDAELIFRLQQAVASNPDANALLSTGNAEVTFRKIIAGLTLQCRVDKWLPSHGPSGKIVDLKTCNTLEQFEREYYFMRYNVRAEFYRLVVSEVLAEMAGVPVAEIPPPDYQFVVVEKSVPHRVKVYTPDEDSLLAGRQEVHADLVTLRECTKTGIWPSGTEGTHSIGLKTWQLSKSLESSAEALEAAT